MEKYMLTENSVAIMKIFKKTIIINVDNIQVFNKSLNKILEYNCTFHGCNCVGRKKAAQKILNCKYKVPIVVSEEKNIVLIESNSPRSNVCLYLVVSKIIDYHYLDNKLLEIICVNNIKFRLKISKKSLENLVIKSIRLNNILNYRKNTNFI